MSSDANDSFEFTTEFAEQKVVKSFIEQTNNRSSQAANINRTDRVIQPTKNETDGSTLSNLSQCSCENPTIDATSQHQSCWAGNLQGKLTTPPAPYYSVLPTLCCACKMMQSLSTCDCGKSIEKTNKHPIPTSSSRNEDKQAEKTTPETSVQRGLSDAEKDGMERKREEARRKRNEARYKLLEPTYHKLDLKTTNTMDQEKKPIGVLPWYSKSLVSPIPAFPRRRVNRISRRFQCSNFIFLNSFLYSYSLVWCNCYSTITIISLLLGL